MNDKEYKTLSESLAGFLTVQSLLFQYLIKTGVIKKEEIANALDFLIDDINKRNPSQAISLPIQRIRDSLETVLPEFPPSPTKKDRPKNVHPDWFQGIIDGGKK